MSQNGKHLISPVFRFSLHLDDDQEYDDDNHDDDVIHHIEDSSEGI